MQSVLRPAGHAKEATCPLCARTCLPSRSRSSFTTWLNIGAFAPQPIMTGTGNSIPRQAQFALEFLV